MRKIFVLGFMLGLGATAAVADTSGTCSIRAGRTEEKMSFSSERGDCVAGHSCHEGSSDMLWSKWSGVTPQDLQREGAAVDARMKAESGEMRCVGTVHDAAMRGAYSFTPDEGFLKRMEAMGFDGLTPGRLEGYAMLDVTTGWVKEMKDAGVTEMTSQKLMGLKALKVDAALCQGDGCGGVSGAAGQQADEYEGGGGVSGEGTGRARYGLFADARGADTDERLQDRCSVCREDAGPWVQ